MSTFSSRTQEYGYVYVWGSNFKRKWRNFTASRQLSLPSACLVCCVLRCLLRLGSGRILDSLAAPSVVVLSLGNTATLHHEMELHHISFLCFLSVLLAVLGFIFWHRTARHCHETCRGLIFHSACYLYCYLLLSTFSSMFSFHFIFRFLPF